MRFKFNEHKTAQAAAHLIKLHGRPKNYMALLKLLYLADRQALIETGSPITGDKMVSMPHGTVLSIVLNLITMGRERQPTTWFEYISEPGHWNEPGNYEVDLLKYENAKLSRYELNVLEKIHEQFGHMNQWALRDLTHKLPEWEDPDGSSNSIFPEKILRFAGKSDEEIEKIISDADELWFIGSFATSDR